MERGKLMNLKKLKKLKKLIPKYAVVPIVVMIAVNFFTFFITPVWTNQLHHYCMEITLDKMLPFVPVFIVPYILAYVQWAVGFIGIARTGEDYCKRFIYGEIIAKTIVCVIFFLMPTTMERAVIERNDVFSGMVALIYSIDAPVNLFPSIHCLESWFCFRGSLNRRYFSRTWTIAMGVMTVLVFLSTVLIKQHLVVDMIGAVAVAEIGLFVSGKLRTEQNRS